MIEFPQTLQKLIDSFKTLPGIGSKTAERLAYYISDRNESFHHNFSENILNILFFLSDPKRVG